MAHSCRGRSYFAVAGTEVATNFFGCWGYTGAIKGGDGVIIYWDLVVLLNFCVDFALIIGTNRLCGNPMKPGRSAIAAVLGGAYAGCCILPGFAFLGNTLWRMVSLVLMSVVAFGCNRGLIRKCILFSFLSMALGGIALGMGSGGFWSLLASASAVLIMCIVGFHGKSVTQRFLPVKLTHKGITREITALLDTGNTLKDPISGEPVLVTGADVAAQLLGFTVEDLAAPIQTMQKGMVQGLRLIPYHAVGQPRGLLLAARLDEVQINGKRSGDLVAFAPQILGTGEYQALAGGVL
jgi:stage II sporulation protein GA (sporulation sigma-E factor processing peptidase)